MLAIFILNVMFGMMLWLANENAFHYLFPMMFLGSILVYCLIGILLCKKEQKRQAILQEQMDRQEVTEWEKSVEEYEEYIEAWAHEIKTPLGLMTFVLDNRKEEISPAVYYRLEYARTIMQEDVERMLYYARLKSARNDYFFTELSLEEVCNEVIAEYRILLQEKKISVMTEYASPHVFSDKKGVQFLITQVISNAIKYQKLQESSSFIHVSTTTDDSTHAIRLIIQDNGIGVKPYDLPFVFEKGFTGEIGEQRKNSTGMGLYLAKQVADHLKVEISVSEEYTSGFEIAFMFPDALTTRK
jgi:signal transduction histidine kinase